MHDPVRAIPLVHRIFLTWHGWPAEETLFPDQPPLASAIEGWRSDGFRFHNIRWTPNLVQIGFEVDPWITPVRFSQRVKGRLDHALRQAGGFDGFSRKVGVRAIGDNTDPIVEDYLAQQQIRAEFADPRYRRMLSEFSGDFSEVDLGDPAVVRRGRYWFNLHVVAVTNGRFRMGREDFLPKISDGIPAWAAGEGMPLRRFALMPDHVHVALRGDPKRSPAEIAHALYVALNRVAGLRLFSDRLYVGTFSAYSKRLLR